MNSLLINALCLPILHLSIFLGSFPVIIDSNMPGDDAIYQNQPQDVVASIQEQLVVVPVRYHGPDGTVHQGQLVVHRMLEDDIREVFDVIEKSNFPVESVLPISHPLIQTKGPYGLSPETNNSSGYVWRPRVRSRQLSMHALGLAVDINPRMNPYIKGDFILPPGATYDPSNPQTLLRESPVVKAFKKRGWEWGGDWKGEIIDYMHFQKIPKNLEEKWFRLVRPY